MTDWLKVLEEKYPVRRTTEQKAAFADAFRATAQKLGWSARVGTLKKNQHAKNLIIGEPDTAKVLVTAGYETPAWSLFPNVLMPRSWLLTAAYFILQALLLLVAAFALLLFAERVCGTKPEYSGILLLTFYIALMLLTGRAFANRRNRNASSGVAAVLAAMEQIPETERGKVAFILFDENTRNGAGARAWGAAHPDIAWSTLTLCLEAVGNGDTLVCARKRAAGHLEEYSVFEEAFAGDEAHPTKYFGHSSLIFPPRKALPCAVQVLACRQAAGIGYYTPRLSTGRDTVAEAENINRVAEKIVKLAEKLS